jgi:hypothetical protein
MNTPKYVGKIIDQRSIQQAIKDYDNKIKDGTKVWLGLKITEGGSIQLKAREHTTWMSIQKIFGYGGWERSEVNNFLKAKDVQKLIPTLLSDKTHDTYESTQKYKDDKIVQTTNTIDIGTDQTFVEGTAQNLSNLKDYIIEQNLIIKQQKRQTPQFIMNLEAPTNRFEAEEVERAIRARDACVVLGVLGDTESSAYGFDFSEISSLEDAEKMSKLLQAVCATSTKKLLDLAGKGLTTLPKEIASMKELEFIDWSRNNLYSIPKEITQRNITLFNSTDNKNLPSSSSYWDREKKSI